MDTVAAWNTTSNPKLVWVAIVVFIVGYLFLRWVDQCLIPKIPEWISVEFRTFIHWAPYLFPVVLAILYIQPRKSEAMVVDDKVLKKRMFFWKKSKQQK